MHPRDLDTDSLPWSPEAEASVLGALMLSNDAWDNVGDMLEAKHFFDERHARVFDAIRALVVACKPADIVTVLSGLEQAGRAESIDLTMLHGLTTHVASASAIRRHAEIVFERALMRGLMEAADDVKRIAIEPGLPVVQRMDKAQARLQALTVHRGRTMPTHIGESVVSLLDRIQDAADGKVVTALSTRIPMLDRMMGGGLKGGKQIIVAARPSVGKSSFAQQICLNLAGQGHPAAFFSQEMTRDELTERAVANLGRIPLDQVITGKLEEAMWTRLCESVEMLRNLPLYFDDQPALSLADISAKARMLKRQHDIKVIVIDYLQLCDGAADENRHHQIEQLSRGLKQLAKQLDITVVALSQLNREVEKRASGRPVLSDLKESGSIEEDADVVILLSRNQVTPTGMQIINCDVPKNRQGKVGSVSLGFDGALQMWHETVTPVEFRSPPRKHYTEDI